MDGEQLESLRSQDWEEIAAKVLSAAYVYATRYGWNRDSSLPNGKSVEDIVMEAIADIWGSPERINPSVPLTTQLKGIVRSKLWNQSQSTDEKVVRSDTMEETALASDPEPAHLVDQQDEFDRAMQLLAEHPKVKIKPDLELVVLALSCGAVEVREIVDETGLTRERVYQLQRELRVIYPSIAEKLQPGEGV
ncbi:MAG: sigma-70 family RNA polymerase sigma factor [Rhodopirellula sp.]|nr:sigma-70 family RNA polymerase sigma factor [Rhodopirellula sp.]